ncbi:MAG: hypothetical protein LBP92_05315 [Deltaproteobacteria bacterium]|jgi:hypothetical protein|nr:hypothetical protein [Deltaproteobacteria bacterium]
MAFSNTRLKVILGLGLLWMALSLAIFLLATAEPSRTQYLGLFFVLFSEAVTLAALALPEVATAGPLLRAGTYSSAGIYAILALALAIVHAAGVAQGPSWLIVGELVLLVLLFSAETLLFVSSRGVAAGDRAAAGRMGTVMDLQARLDRLSKLDSLGPELGAKLGCLVEEIRFFDRGASVPSDLAISEKIAQLEGLFPVAGGDVPAGAASLLDEIQVLARVRQNEAAGSRRGGF